MKIYFKGPVEFHIQREPMSQEKFNVLAGVTVVALVALVFITLIRTVGG